MNDITRETVTLEKDDTTIDIGGVSFSCSVECEAEVDYTPSYSGQMTGRTEDADPPHGAEVDVKASRSDVTIYDDKGEEIGKLILRGTEWFDEWFDHETVVEQLEGN